MAATKTCIECGSTFNSSRGGWRTTCDDCCQPVLKVMIARGITFHELAEAVGCSVQQVSQVVNGSRQTHWIRRRVSLALGLPRKQLFRAGKTKRQLRAAAIRRSRSWQAVFASKEERLKWIRLTSEASCDICGEEATYERPLELDTGSSGKPRGVLCTSCSALVRASGTRRRLRLALNYLERAHG